MKVLSKLMNPRQTIWICLILIMIQNIAKIITKRIQILMVVATKIKTEIMVLLNLILTNLILLKMKIMIMKMKTNPTNIQMKKLKLIKKMK